MFAPLTAPRARHNECYSTHWLDFVCFQPNRVKLYLYWLVIDRCQSRDVTREVVEAGVVSALGLHEGSGWCRHWVCTRGRRGTKTKRGKWQAFTNNSYWLSLQCRRPPERISFPTARWIYIYPVMFSNTSSFSNWNILPCQVARVCDPSQCCDVFSVLAQDADAVSCSSAPYNLCRSCCHRRCYWRHLANTERVTRLDYEVN